MKKYLFFIALAVMATSVTSCQKDFPDEPFAIRDISVGTCKLNGEFIKGFDPEYITLNAIDNYYILFNHINSIFNCDPGQITVFPEISAGTIIINETKSGQGMHCVCPYDITFILGPLQYGSYSLNFQKEGITFKEYLLDFNKSTDIKIDI